MTNQYGFTEVEPEFLALMPANLRVTQFSGRDAYGKETYGTSPILIPMHMEDRSENLTTANGDVRPVSGKAYLGWIVPWLTTNDKAEVPSLSSATGWETAMIAVVINRYGAEGIHHQEIYFGERGESGHGAGA
jgi:hypothetical protein